MHNDFKQALDANRTIAVRFASNQPLELEYTAAAVHFCSTPLSG
jgi:hypothetical protein